MSGEDDEIVGSIGRELVSHLAPEELPLYPSLLTQFQDPKQRRGRRGSSDDQMLGFGAAEAITMITPVVLGFTRGFWEALIAEAAHDSVHGIVEYVKAHRAGHRAPEPPPLTQDQLKLVRTVAEREGRRLDLSEKRVRLLADAMVGLLAAPPAP